MPRQTKEAKKVIELEEKDKKKTAKTIKKVNGDSKKTTTKKKDSKTSTAKKSVVKKDSKTTKSVKSFTKEDAKTPSTEKKKATKKVNKASKIAKDSATKKPTDSKTKASTTQKTSVTRTKKTSSKSVKNEIIEYYDLPYRYNKTVVKILAQTPKKLFVYWDISDSDRKNFIKTYGENFFDVTRPVLIIRNITMNYSFEVDINDFANSWYLNINDSDCKYSIELGRRPKEYNSNVNTDYIYVSSSNNIEAPNDRILFNDQQGMVYFRNVKTNFTTAKKLTSLSFISNMGIIYNIYDLYKKIYADEELDEINNPSSSFFK